MYLCGSRRPEPCPLLAPTAMPVVASTAMILSKIKARFAGGGPHMRRFHVSPEWHHLQKQSHTVCSMIYSQRRWLLDSTRNRQGRGADCVVLQRECFRPYRTPPPAAPHWGSKGTIAVAIDLVPARRRGRREGARRHGRCLERMW